MKNMGDLYYVLLWYIAKYGLVINKREMVAKRFMHISINVVP